MPAPPVYLDECVDCALVEALRKRGFSLTCAADEKMAGLAVGDDPQLAYATAHDWVLVTHNGGHFYRLHLAYRRRGQSHGGIVLLPDTSPPERVEIRIAMLLDWLAEVGIDPRSQLFTWGQLQGHFERGYRLPGYSDDDLRLALGR